MIKLMKRIIKKGFNLISGRRQEPAIPKPFECPVCGKHTDMEPFPLYYFEQLQQHGFIHNIFLSETLNLLHFSCKSCGALDRDRLTALYLSDYLSDKQKIRFLDIAPGTSLRQFLQQKDNIIYRSADLYRKDVDDNVDITDMRCYSDESFDFFICSHVLEHVYDDKKALSELHRILQKGGHGIIMVPINLGVENTIEDTACTDIPTRWKLFGQDDHLRMYSKQDFIKSMELAGFTVAQLGETFFGAEAFQKAAIYPNSILYVVSK